MLLPGSELSKNADCLVYRSVPPNQYDLGQYQQKYTFRSMDLIILIPNALYVQYWGAYFKGTEIGEQWDREQSRRDLETPLRPDPPKKSKG